MSLTTLEPRAALSSTDPVLAAISQAIEPYLADHPTARFDQYRQSRLNVRLRIVDQDFEGIELDERQDRIDRYLDILDDESANQLSFLALVTPNELLTSHINYEFEHPSWTDIE